MSFQRKGVASSESTVSASGSSTDLRPLFAEAAGTKSKSSSLLATLSLREEALIDGWAKRLSFQVLQFVIRCLPAIVLYGGTLSLIVCVLLRYRWGVLMSMLLYTVYMWINSWELALFGAWGIFQCWVNGRIDWFGLYCKEAATLQGASPKSTRELLAKDLSSDSLHKLGQMFVTSAEWSIDDAHSMAWNDVIHIVMVPTYKTPRNVLDASLNCLEQFSLARSNMMICMAFEEREEGCHEKAAKLMADYEGRFMCMFAAFHPPNLPGHVPGKSSNECWAFFELQKELTQKYSIDTSDPRVVITVIDDDSEMHENYFEALTYHFLQATESQRNLTIWQPPIVHFKNFLTQPVMVRTASIITSLHELACLANPIDCHVPFSTYSLSLMLATAVGGWDPDYISEDWHMFAKCSLRTEGRVRCRPIFLPLINYAPEEDTCYGTMKSRWTQATRHALGVSEVVYVVMHVFLGVIELGHTPLRALSFLNRMLPVIGKFIGVHFVVGTLAIWPMLSHFLINAYMWRSWCDVNELANTCATCCVPMAAAEELGIGEERIILNSWMVYFQQQANALMVLGLLVGGGMGVFYLHLLKDRVEGNFDEDWVVRNKVTLWVRMQLEFVFLGWASSLFFASIPEWLAAGKIIFTLRFTHVVAGMVGRDDNGNDSV